MDDPSADPVQLRLSLRYLRRINGLLGYTRSTLAHLRRFSSSWQVGETIRILDVATGSADVPRAILSWARRRGLRVTVSGLDLHARTAREAIVAAGNVRGLSIVQGDALHLPFADQSFDYVVSSLFLHHLDDPAVRAALAEMNRVAARGLIVGDLLRHRRAYGWFTVLSAFANSMVRHDGRVSVMQAFTQAEVLAIRREAGVEYARFHRHFGHRFVLAGEREPCRRQGSGS